MSDTSKQLLIAFSKTLRDRQNYLAGVQYKYSNFELEASSANTVKSIAEDFEKILASILCDEDHTPSDPYIKRLMTRETNRRTYIQSEPFLQISMF